MSEVECNLKVKKAKKMELLWFIAIYALIIIIIAVAAGLALSGTETKETEFVMLMFFSVIALVVTSFGAYYFCVATFQSPSSPDEPVAAIGRL